MQFRRAAALVATFEAGSVVVHNYLDRSRFSCSAECLQFLASLDEWQPAEKLFAYFPGADRADLADQIAELAAAKALVVKGTPQAKQDEKYRREWQWGEVAGFFHFSIRETPFISGKPARALMRKRKAWRRSPALVQSNRAASTLIRLPPTDLTQQPLALMSRRRSVRQFSSTPISLRVLADCLFAGNGVLEVREDEDYGRLPITMTPSGGARNPFELYVYA